MKKAGTTKPDKYLGLTEDEFNQFSSAANRTWQEIGGDCAELNDGKPFTRAEVIELALDADRMRMYGERGKDWEELYDTRIRPWLTKNYDSPAFRRLMKEVFRYKFYE